MFSQYMSPSTPCAHNVFVCIYRTVRSYMIAIPFAVRDRSSGVAYQLCVRRQRVIVLTQASVAQWHFALCPVSVSTVQGSRGNSEFILLINTFPVFVLIILFAQALNQARFIFTSRKLQKKICFLQEQIHV